MDHTPQPQVQLVQNGYGSYSGDHTRISPQMSLYMPNHNQRFGSRSQKKKQSSLILASPDQVKAIRNKKSLLNTEKNLKQNSYYDYLINFELAVWIIGLIVGAILWVNNGFSHGKFAGLITASVFMVIGCTFALVAKAKLDAQKQYSAQVLLIIGIILGNAEFVFLAVRQILDYNYQQLNCTYDGSNFDTYSNCQREQSDQATSQLQNTIFTIIIASSCGLIHLVCGVLIVLNSRKLVYFMKNRHILKEVQTQENTFVVAA